MADNDANKYPLKKRMRDDFTKYFFVALSLVPSLSKAATTMLPHDSDTQKTTVVQKTNDSAVENAEQLQIRIGNWTESQLGSSMTTETSYKRPSIKNLPTRPDALVVRDKVKWEKMNNGALAVTNSEGFITMELPDAERATKAQSQISKNFLAGESVSQITEFLHEVNHAKDIEHFHISPQYNTPTNAVRYNNLTENVSHVVSYLASANFYQNMEKQGIQTIQVNGEEKPLSYILDNYLGLRQTYEKYGLDVNDPQSVARYVKLGKAFKNIAKDQYDAKAYDSFVTAREIYKNKPWNDKAGEAKSEDKDFDEISHLMVSKVYIGQNTYVDLSSCYDLLNDMSKQDVYTLVEKQSDGEDHVVPSENIVAIDKYLTQKGISDDEKDDYIAAQFFAIVEKENDVDIRLKNIMMQSQILYEHDNRAQVNYSDGTSDKIIPVIDLTGNTEKDVKTADFMLAYHSMSRGGR